MLSIQIVCVGKLKERYLKDAIDEYSKRLSRFCKLSFLELPDQKIPDKLNSTLADEIKTKECNCILQHLKKDSFVFALDLNGKEFSSEEFSTKIQEVCLNFSSITFVIGGSLGLTDDLLSLCQERICFSKMTFPHQLIRIFLLEQIFRGFKIANGETYHR